MQEPSSFPAVKLQYPEQEQLKCPRCDSSNTKFCYYNNYNLSQPRYFCKNCRRYWTKGGTLRNIPVGGGTRKNNKRSSNPKRSSSSYSSSSSSQVAATQTTQPLPASPAGLDNPGGNGMDDKNKLLEQSGGTGSVSFLMGSNGQLGSLLEDPSPSGSDVKMLSFGNNSNSSAAIGYVGLQSGETSYWSDANVWPDIESFNPPRSSI